MELAIATLTWAGASTAAVAAAMTLFHLILAAPTYGTARGTAVQPAARTHGVPAIQPMAA